MTTMNEERAGYMPIPTAEQLAEALAKVRCFHDLSAELIAPELLANLLAALSAQPAQQGEVVEVVAWQDAENPLYTTAERRLMHEWANNQYPIVELMTVAQHKRILAASVPAGCKVVPVELLERLEHVTRTLVPHLQCHVDLRALLASAEGVKDE